MLLTDMLLFTLKNPLSIFAGIFGIGFVIGFHECGHFLFGKLFGLNIPSFSIGFGPHLFTRKIGSTTFSVSLIPVGGYVESESGTYDNPKPGTIASLSYWQKMLMIGGGILFNLIFAYVIFTALSVTGIPGNPFFAKNVDHYVKQVVQGSAAQKAGIKPHDKIIAVDALSVKKDLPALMKFLAASPDKTVTALIERDGKKHTVPLTIGSKKIKNKEVGILGVGFEFAKTPGVPLSQAFSKGWFMMWDIIKGTFGGFRKAAVERSAEGFAGPLMMISLCIQMATKSWLLLLFLLAFISVGLAVLNVIPLPILDGGQALTYTIEALLGRPLCETTLTYIHYASWVFMLALILYLTFKDVIAMWF